MAHCKQDREPVQKMTVKFTILFEEERRVYGKFRHDLLTGRLVYAPSLLAPPFWQ